MKGYIYGNGIYDVGTKLARAKLNMMMPLVAMLTNVKKRKENEL